MMAEAAAAVAEGEPKPAWRVGLLGIGGSDGRRGQAGVGGAVQAHGHPFNDVDSLLTH